MFQCRLSFRIISRSTSRFAENLYVTMVPHKQSFLYFRMTFFSSLTIGCKNFHRVLTMVESPTTIVNEYNWTMLAKKDPSMHIRVASWISKSLMFLSSIPFIQSNTLHYKQTSYSHHHKRAAKLICHLSLVEYGMRTTNNHDNHYNANQTSPAPNKGTQIQTR